MKKNDLLFVAFMAALFLPFFVSADAYAFYNQANAEHGMLLSFLKFALLATAGEMLGLRIRTGSYNQPGFGILPRAIVWGLLGFTIKLAFVIFGKGTPAFLTYMGLEDAGSLMGGAFGAGKLLVAFSISAAMNLIYAPVMMTLHKITDTHIHREGGALSVAMRRAEVFPPVLVYMTASGESSGRVEAMLMRAADYLEREFETFTATLLSLLEPAIIVLLGGVVATIVLSILLPILQINNLALN